MSAVSDLFVVKLPQPPTVKGDTKAAGTKEEAGVPVFLTVKTLGSFATGTFFVGLAWKLLKVLLPNSPWIGSAWTPVLISLVYGVAVFCASVSDPGARPKTSAGWIAAVIVGIFNSLLLAAAALGIVGLLRS
jgi:hypothetical protein